MDFEEFPFPHRQKQPETEEQWFSAIANLARFLRSPEGCPWDQERTALEFARYAREEVDEFIESLEHGKEGHPEEELGDAIFCLLAASAAAEAEGRLQLQDVLQKIHEKMIRRHEHVFGPNKAESPQDAIDSWNRVKAREKGEEQDG